MTSIEYLKTEIERLNKELQQASCDKIRAGQYGLAVLEEKQRIHEQYDDLVTLFENTKHELESSKEVTMMPDDLIILVPYIQPKLAAHIAVNCHIHTASCLVES